ncbi:O-antigen ligase family protein [Geitlerinema sp. P-1104]|uniref:O-antigen ligase family protein n=1 Tax=Geitlerinema sp. P-1104 TaxID=2546230 RepID=UPI0014776E69|nr:O-antigen ligase family protein [Geitlerinema sp. P-1104]
MMSRPIDIYLPERIVHPKQTDNNGSIKPLMRPQQSLYLGLLIFPLSPLLGGIAIVGVTAWHWWQDGRSHLQQPLTWSFTLAALLLLLSSLQAHDPSISLLGLANILPFMVICIASRALIQHPQHRQHLSQAIVLSSLPVALIGLGQQYLGWHGPIHLGWLISWDLEAGGTPPGRMASVFGYANSLANFSLIAWTLAIGLTLQAWRSQQRAQVATGLLLICLNSIVLFETSSRNSWAVAIVIALIYGILLRWYWLLGVIGAIAAIIIGAAFGPPPLQSPLQQIVPRAIWARLNDDLYPNRPVETLRITQWQFAWDLSQERPLWGWGLRQFPQLYQAETGAWLGHPHNLPLMFLSETGILATLALFIPIGWIYYQGVRHLKHLGTLNLIPLSILLAFTATSLFHLVDVTLFDARVNILGWLLLAAIDSHQPDLRPSQITL